MAENKTFWAFFFVSILIFFLTGISWGDESVPYVKTLVKEMIARNPDLAKMREHRSAKEHRVSPAGTLPDPMVGVGITNMRVDDFDFGREAMTSKDIFFSQSFPFPGKLSLKKEIADIQAKQAGMTVQEFTNLLSYKTERSYYWYYEVTKSIAITEETKTVLEQFVEITRQRYAVGKALQQDIFKAQAALLNVKRRLFTLDQMRVEAVALINTLRSMPVDEKVKVPSSLPFSEVTLSKKDLLKGAKEHNPALLRLRLAVNEGKKRVSLAKMQLLPDFTLSARYRQREMRSDFATGALTLKIPLYAWSKQRELIKSDTFMLNSRQRALDSYIDTLAFQVEKIGADLFSLKNRITLLEGGVIPEAREEVNAAMSAYTVGKLEFISLLSSELNLFKYELELAGLRTRYNERVAKLWHIVVGKDLTTNEVHDE